ncbi:MAG: phosphoribosylformylglycinamidine cyclo-ligase [Clostridiales Family XIII bacterium]|nr:phosphoribosylformylglycinamidine cyclo-ligase [Clostridiales Family XIII bacterium]
MVKRIKTKTTYKDAGVDTVEAARAVSLMKDSVRRTFGPEVLTGLGSFGSLFQPDLTGIRTPVLVAGTDGVGTKLKVAMLMDKHDTIGIDLVAMCANDVLCQGAKPLFFLDYIATGHVKAEKVADIVRGVADGCGLAGCALVGGETAEMPGFYAPDDYDLAGFCVGIVDRDKVVDGSRVGEGDLLIGVPSSGLHSNGYSLVRKVLFEKFGFGVGDRAESLGIGGAAGAKPAEAHCEGPSSATGVTLGDILLEPTRIYAAQAAAVLERLTPHAIVHITGGGFFENIPRVLPDGLGARVNIGTWDIPPVFSFIQEKAGINDEEIFSTLNMGIGLIFVVPVSDRAATLAALEAAGEAGAGVIGKVVRGDGVTLVPPRRDRLTDGVGEVVFEGIIAGLSGL